MEFNFPSGSEITLSEGGEPSPVLAPAVFSLDSDYWFSDGNIVIVCETTGFRVHQSVLALHSTVFKDIFTVCDHGPQGETFGGCPVVRLPDAADDFLQLLKALYLLRYPPPTRTVKLEDLGNLLHIATKYKCIDVRNEAVDHLRALFPTTYGELKQDFGYMPLVELNGLLGVEIALKCQVPEILPVACYRAAFKGALSIIDSAEVPGEASLAARRLCLDSKDKLVTTLSVLCDDLIWSMHEFPCQSVGAVGCMGISSSGMHYFEAFFKDLMEPCFGLTFRLANADPEFEQLCSACWEKLDDIENTLRRRLWDALPGHCGFKDWEAVKTAQTALDADIIVGGQ